MKEQHNDRMLFNFFVLGCETAMLCRNNILYYDFHKDNVLFDKDGNFAVVDMDGVELLDFPEEIERYASGIINLYTNFGMEYGAAFRYGFVNVAGEIGEILYDTLYNKYGLTVIDDVENPREIDLNIENLRKVYIEWNELVDNSFVKKVTNGAYEYGEFSFIELMQRNETAYRKFKDIYINNIGLIKHEYQTYFANGIYSGNDFDIVGASLMLCQLEFYNEKYFLAVYYYFLALSNMLGNEDCKISLMEDFQHTTNILESRFGEKGFKRLYDYIFFETFKLRIERSIGNNYFFEIWYWLDFAKVNLVDDFTVDRQYGCYKCLNCNHADFFEKEIKKCELCESEELKVISLLEYISLKESLLMSEKDSFFGENITEDICSIAELPELDRISLFPMYIKIINICHHSEKYNDAIELAQRVENFLKNHPEICDKKGYIIEKAREGGQVFFSPTTPNKLAKLFLEETDNVRNDYESYILHKLCILYKENGNNVSALEYARKIIDLANNSPRWINQHYITDAYLIVQTYYANVGNHKNELMYANILFTYSMLDMIDNDYFDDNSHREKKNDVVTLVSIGKINANAGNVSLAYSCYLLALRLHIYYHGSRHPETAIIYSGIAQLLVRKKLYDEAYAFWSVSLLLLERSKIEQYRTQILETENIISKCLFEIGYQGSLSDWKKEWMTDSAFNIFPEKKHEKNDSSKVEISKDEMLKEFIVYIP